MTNSFLDDIPKVELSDYHHPIQATAATLNVGDILILGSFVPIEVVELRRIYSGENIFVDVGLRNPMIRDGFVFRFDPDQKLDIQRRLYHRYEEVRSSDD